MNAEFKNGKTKRVVNDRDVEIDVELVTLSGGYLGKDSMTREVTEDDKLLYGAEYEAFKNPPAPGPDPKDAKIAELEAALDEATKPAEPA